MTNREWVNSLTDEQFIKFMRTFKENDCVCCVDGYTSLDDGCGDCYEKQVAWLSQEHNFDDWEERSYRYCV